MVDVYFRGSKILETLAVAEPGKLTFRSPADIVSRLDAVVKPSELRPALEGPLPSNSDQVCSLSNRGQCGLLSPDGAGIIYDEDKFRVDLFVNPKWLEPAERHSNVYLPVPDAPLSLTNAVGLNLSGTVGSAMAYNFQNRTIVGLRNARIRANTSLASRFGLVVDDLVGEMERKNLRYSGGLFWSPSNEFTGQRRIIGAGVGTQFDTAAERDTLRGTPLIAFLAQPSRVELLVDGRLVSARSYPAGNADIDTSALSDGSYSVILRIQQANGAVREERRFFVKNAQIVPAGHPTFYGYAGVLANTRRHRPINPSDTLYYQTGVALRLNNNFAVDVTALGTQHKMIVQAGAWLIKGPARVRASAMGSTAGDKGAAIQASTAGSDPVNISFDLRRIWSTGRGPLLPLPSHVDTFSRGPLTAAQLAGGSYTQVTGSVGVRLGSGFLSFVGSYRKDRDLKADYTLGPSVTMPLVTRNGLQVVVDASAQRTRATTAAFAGLRVLFTSGRMSFLSTMGHALQDDGRARQRSRAVSTFTAQYSRQGEDQSSLNLAAGVDRNIASSTVHAAGTWDSRFGHVRADLLHSVEGQGGTQYDLAFQSGMALGGNSVALGSRNMEQSAVVVTLSGDAPGAEFKVLVDDVERGRVRLGQRLPIFLAAYHTYGIRLEPATEASVEYDAAPRAITLYPGNVQSLGWRADKFFTLFGQAFTAEGTRLSNALVKSPRGIAETDGEGYFQVDARQGDVITISKGDAPPCSTRLGQVLVKDSFASVGKVTCQ